MNESTTIPEPREGPRAERGVLRCTGCCYHTREPVMQSRRPWRMSGYRHFCAHAEMRGEAERREIGPTDWTPRWCPVAERKEPALAEPAFE